MISIILFLLLSFQIFADSSNYAVTEGSPSALVAGAVNAITGDHYIAEVDYQVQAAAPLNLPRTYISSRNGAHVGWQLFHHLYAAYYADKEEDPRRYRVQLIEPNGSTLNFERSYKKQKQKHTIIFNPIDLSAQGLTNTGRGEISGKTHLKNVRVEMSENRTNLTVYGSDGAVRYYNRVKNPHDSMPKELLDNFTNGSNISVNRWYMLQWEKLPNQTCIFYEYGSKDRLKAVRTTNHNNTKTYAWAGFNYHSSHKKITILTSTPMTEDT